MRNDREGEKWVRCEKRDPRVLILSHMYPSSVAPTDGIFIHNEVRALLEVGLDVRVVSPVPWAPRILWFRQKWRQYAAIHDSGSFDKMPVARISYPALPHPLNAVDGMTMAASLRQRLASLRKVFPFDLIHSHTLTPDGWAGCLLAKQFSVPAVCTVRGSDLNDYPYYSRIFLLATRYVLRRSNAVITTSRDLAEGAVRLAHESVCPVVIYKGVNGSIFAPRRDRKPLRTELALPPNGKLILFVGRCERDKGIEELFQVFRRIQRQYPSICLLVVGDGSHRKQLTLKAAQAGLTHRIILPGRVPHSQVTRYFQACDIFVLPSYGEGMPNALLEAMACGLACVATSVGGIPEVLEDGVSGLLVPARDEKALEIAIRDVLSSRDLAARLGAEAAKRVRLQFSWRANSEQNIEVYRQVLTSLSRKTHSPP